MKADPPRLLDLFAGIGGFSIGFERCGFKTMAFVENDPKCQRRLARQWGPRVPILGDIKNVNLGRGAVDVITCGFPCQRFSTAARGRNVAEDLWPEGFRVIRQVRPAWAVAENVPGIGHDGVERVCRDFESEGYKVWPFDPDTALPARQRGRHRILWLAYADDAVHHRLAEHAKMARLRALSTNRRAYHSRAVGVDDGIPEKMDRLKMLGNAMTPDGAELVARAILTAMR